MLFFFLSHINPVTKPNSMDCVASIGTFSKLLHLLFLSSFMWVFVSYLLVSPVILLLCTISDFLLPHFEDSHSCVSRSLHSAYPHYHLLPKACSFRTINCTACIPQNGGLEGQCRHFTIFRRCSHKDWNGQLKYPTEAAHGSNSWSGLH